MLTQAEIAAINGFDTEDDYLEHWGILGMKWGIRRYQNPDGSLTSAGRARYLKQEQKKRSVMQSGNIKKILKYQKHLTDAEFDKAMARANRSEELRKVGEIAKNEKKQAKLSEKQMNTANQVARQEAKAKVKSVNTSDLLGKGLAIAASVAAAYKTYKKIAEMVNDLTGKKLPGVDGKLLFDFSDKEEDGSSKKTTSTPTTPSPASPKTESKPTSSPSASETTPKPTPTVPTKETSYKDTYVHKGYSKESAYELSRSPLGSVKMESIKSADISTGKSILSELGSTLGTVKMESIKPADVSAGKLILDDWLSGSSVGYDYTKREKVRMPSL